MPFRFEPYRNEFAGSIGEIMARQGSIRANAVRQRGLAKANTIGTIGQAGQHFIGNIGQIMQAQREAPMRAQDRELDVRKKMADIAKIEADIVNSRADEQQAAIAQDAVRKAMSAAGGDKMKAADILLNEGWVELAKNIRGQVPRRNLQNVSPGQSVIDTSTPEAGALFTAPAAEKPPPSTIDAAIMEAYRSGNGAEVNRLLQLKRQSGDAGRAPEGSGAQEPLVPIIGPDGQPVLVPRSQAVGKRPASNREQGRPVTSGDANRIAELDTSLNDLATLGATLTETEKATGTAAKVGASLWNPITELTGWGEDAKKRQGVIDRVKQVIGKALEGGVLRKEDEYKYTKILPTIGDTQAVAASKLDGLRKALILRRDTTLDALEDSNYDVSKHRQRSGATVEAPATDPLGLFK